jgi:putative ABC transport system substrate-binding protein
VLQTSTLPVVFIAGDPVTSGFAVSLAKPGGNATGVSVLTRDLEPKRLDLLHEVAPRARRVGYLRNNANPLAEQLLEDVRAAARVVKLQIDPLNASTVDELKHTLSIIGRRTPDALIVSPESFFLAHKAEIAQAVRKAKLPTVFPYSDYHADGAFMSYGPNLKTTSRLLATYVDRILRGAKPAELPVEQMSKYDLIIDLRIAHELGIHVPNQMLLRADEVIR